MLILSRKRLQKVVFPRLGVSIEVLRLKGNSVCLGIDAPKDLCVLRGELSHEENTQLTRSIPSDFGASADGAPEPNQLLDHHEVRNRLNTISLVLHLLNSQQQADVEVDFSLIERALKQVHAIDQILAHSASSVPPDHETSNGGRIPFVVVVDDEVDESQLLATYLRQEGMKVTTIEDGATAVRQLRKMVQKPDVILLDMTMPGLDGFATLELLRRNRELDQTKVFAVTGLNIESCEKRHQKLAFDRWFG